MKKTLLKSNEFPDVDPALLDVHRPLARAQGGTYIEGNMQVMLPVDHMKEHGTYRKREKWLEELKALMDSRQQTLKTALKLNNQMLAITRGTDHPNQADVEWVTEMQNLAAKREGVIKRQIMQHIAKSDHPVALSARNVAGMGPITIAALLTYIDIEKASSASAVWAYTGLHAASHERYTKNEAGGGNKTLRTALWNGANAMTKNRSSPYRDVYDRTKARLQASKKLTKTRVSGKTGVVEMPWCDVSDGHRHGAALRKVMKEVLADYWFVARSYAGLDTRPLYVEGQLGHTGIIRPQDRGWILPE